MLGKLLFLRGFVSSFALRCFEFAGDSLGQLLLLGQIGTQFGLGRIGLGELLGELLLLRGFVIGLLSELFQFGGDPAGQLLLFG